MSSDSVIQKMLLADFLELNLQSRSLKAPKISEISGESRGKIVMMKLPALDKSKNAQ